MMMMLTAGCSDGCCLEDNTRVQPSYQQLTMRWVSDNRRIARALTTSGLETEHLLLPRRRRAVRAVTARGVHTGQPAHKSVLTSVNSSDKKIFIVAAQRAV